MREVLNQSSDDEEDDNEPTSKSNSPGESNFVICAPDVLPDIGSVLKHPSGSQLQSLHSLFITNVEPVVKTLHVPSLRRYFVEGSGEIDCSPGPKGWDALKFAIYYTATTSLTADECLQYLGEEKAVFLPTLRSSTELALARADFVNTEDMSTLQALVLYLVSCSFRLISSPILSDSDINDAGGMLILFGSLPIEVMRTLGVPGH
jgi:hypothetical protein